ncbi:unnamed protein product [Pleuronectes platessa]|uniref:Uncharacterized protein n=1 Tax=Pleuronectes platessa TaxID=8262 RepID=A0A9N7UWM1_PLEPL|nr:unnamed protein product [Pleuronectes platessa]
MNPSAVVLGGRSSAPTSLQKLKLMAFLIEAHVCQSDGVPPPRNYIHSPAPRPPPPAASSYWPAAALGTDDVACDDMELLGMFDSTHGAARRHNHSPFTEVTMLPPGASHFLPIAGRDTRGSVLTEQQGLCEQLLPLLPSFIGIQ